MTCISAETGTFVFAIINLVLVSGWSFSGIVSLILCGMGVIYHQSVIGMQLTGMAMILILLFLSLVTLLFSSLLMNGILMKKPQHIKAYYIFGILTEVLTFLALLTAIFGGEINSIVNTIIFGLYIGYSLILYMIRCTYLKIEINQQNPFDPRLIFNKC